MTHWVATVHDIPPLADVPVALALTVSHERNGLSATEQHRLLRRQALTTLTTASLGMDKSKVRLAVDASGRRHIAGTEIFASVAHRAGRVAAVIARVPVGVDLESVEEATNAAEVVLSGIETPIDVAAWHGLAGIWAAREAVLKAQGRDLTLDHDAWTFGEGWVQAGAMRPLRVDLASRDGIVAAVAYVVD